MKKYAVILSGCGFLDGAEIHESVLTLLNLDKNDMDYDVFAPDKNQHHVINHLKGEEVQETRNVLVEAARIARGDIHPLSELNPDNYSALLMPGGFGAAKNLSDLALQGPKASPIADLERVVSAFYQQKKVIGVICISPAVISSILGKEGIEVTIGNDRDTAQAIVAMGAKHIDKEVTEIHVDEKNRIVSTAAYMYQARISHVAQGVEKLVLKVKELTA